MREGEKEREREFSWWFQLFFRFKTSNQLFFSSGKDSSTRPRRRSVCTGGRTMRSIIWSGVTWASVYIVRALKIARLCPVPKGRSLDMDEMPQAVAQRWFLSNREASRLRAEGGVDLSGHLFALRCHENPQHASAASSLRRWGFGNWNEVAGRVSHRLSIR